MVQTEKIEWRGVEIRPGVTIDVRPVDPEINAKMPVLKPTRQEQFIEWVTEHFGKKQ